MQTHNPQENLHKVLHKVLIVGNGGREYALGLHLKQDSRIQELFFTPGNAGTALLGTNLTLPHNQDIVEFCQKEGFLG